MAKGSDLQILDPSTHSLAYLHILSAHIEAARSAPKASTTNLPPALLLGGRLWPRIVAILQRFDRIQARYAGSHFRYVLEVVALGARQTSHVSRA